MTRPSKDAAPPKPLPPLIAWPDMGLELDMTTKELRWPGGSQILPFKLSYVLGHLIDRNKRGITPSAKSLAQDAATSIGATYVYVNDLREILRAAGLTISTVKYEIKRIESEALDSESDLEKESPSVQQPSDFPASSSPPLPSYMSTGPDTRYGEASVAPLTAGIVEIEPPVVAITQSSLPADQPSVSSLAGAAPISNDEVSRPPRIPWNKRYAEINTLILLAAAIPPLFIDSQLPSSIYGIRTYPLAPMALVPIALLLYAASKRALRRSVGRRAVPLYLSLVGAAVSLLPFYGPEFPHAHVLFLSAHWGLYLAGGLAIDDVSAPSSPLRLQLLLNGRSMEVEAQRLAWCLLLCVAVALHIGVVVADGIVLPGILTEAVSALPDKEFMRSYAYATVGAHLLVGIGVAPIPQLFQKAFLPDPAPQP